MILLRNIGWGALAVATLAIAAAADLVTLPVPQGAMVLDHATFLPGNDEGREVSLPHAVFPRLGQLPATIRYLTHFELPAVPDDGLFLLIPTLNRRISLVLNGETLFDSGSRTLWSGPLASTAELVQLPRAILVAGSNQLTVIVEAGRFIVPTYLSQIYLGNETSLAPNFTLRVFFGNQLATMAVGAHALLGVGLILAYFLRPKDPLFAWLAALNVVSLIIAVGMFIGFQPAIRAILPYIVTLIPASAVLFIGVALALIDVPPPKALRLIAIAVTCVLLPCALIDTPLTRTISALSAVTSMVVLFVAGTGLIAWGAFRRGNAEARLMIAPSFLMAWFAVQDSYVTATLPNHAYNLLLPYARPLYLAFITAVLMRRMGVSLDQVDRANENLNARLAEREAELAVLHRQERAKTASTVREQERQRLTHDLHDGISGHLVSIIALSERAGDKSTEQAAREALNDLRLVIYSLDLGDRELPLALANFRERLVPQLHRLGVDLDWSIAGLPEVTGVTPGNALAILRILQEAITNALKHGPARKIIIRGARAPDGMVAIMIENDGRPFVENNGGHGLVNMRRRAEQLHGQLRVESIEHGAKITLLLPSRLPDFEDEAVV